MTGTALDERAHAAAQWFAGLLDATGRDASAITPGHARCLGTLTALTEPSGLYNLPTVGPIVDAVALWPGGAVSVLTHATLCTSDFDRLTRLVVAAHRDHVRIGVGPWAFHADEGRAAAMAAWLNDEHSLNVPADDAIIGVGVMEITCHPKAATGEHRWEVHPGLDDLIARVEAAR